MKFKLCYFRVPPPFPLVQSPLSEQRFETQQQQELRNKESKRAQKVILKLRRDMTGAKSEIASLKLELASAQEAAKREKVGTTRIEAGV